MTVQFVGDSSFHFVSFGMTRVLSGQRQKVAALPLLSASLTPWKRPSFRPQGGILYKLHRHFDAVALQKLCVLAYFAPLHLYKSAKYAKTQSFLTKIKKASLIARLFKIYFLILWQITNEVYLFSKFIRHNT